MKPVMFPPGRGRLCTSPAPTGSATTAITIGMVVVACFAAKAHGVKVATIMSTGCRTKSVAKPGRRSVFPSADRNSNT
jgi:hypothetical protein